MEDNRIHNWVKVILSEMSHLENQEGQKVIEKCGRACANNSQLLEKVKEVRRQFSDDASIVELFHAFKEKAYNSPNFYMKEEQIYLEFKECTCPLVKDGKVDNPFLCHCTQGYTKEIFETLFGRTVNVELQKSILNGDDICRQVISVQPSR